MPSIFFERRVMTITAMPHQRGLDTQRRNHDLVFYSKIDELKQAVFQLKNTL